MLSFHFLPLLAFSAISMAAPTQTPLTDTSSKEFPIPQPLPFNATIPGVNYDLIAKLRDSPNAITRIALLQDADFAFDFVSPPNVPAGIFNGKGGTLVTATSVSMPALVDNGMAMAVGFTKAWFAPAISCSS